MSGPISNFRDKRAAISGSSYQSATNQIRAKSAAFEEAEKCFVKAMRKPLRQAAKIKEADIVVGIPFYNEAETVGSVLKTVSKGLEEFYPD